MPECKCFGGVVSPTSYPITVLDRFWLRFSDGEMLSGVKERGFEGGKGGGEVVWHGEREGRFLYQNRSYR